MKLEYIPYQRFLVEIQVLDEEKKTIKTLFTERIKSGTEARGLADRLNAYKCYNCIFIDMKPKPKKKTKDKKKK